MILDFLKSLVVAFWDLFSEMSPYLVLGFLLAGILHVYFPKDKVNKYLGKRNLKSVINAALVGVPLPLCSCGVIPTGVSFHKNGASKGASVSFLISTPQTGVDSILATYSLMGLPFAVIRPIVALITGITGGLFTNKALQSEPEPAPTIETETINKGNKFKRMLRYAFVDFLQDIAKWLLIGLGIAALITVAIPDSVFENYLSNPYLNMFLVLLASVPMYVCATGSIPIATALLMKGISPGAAFVFLMAGPATNAGTMTVIGQSLGKKALFTYMASIISGAVIFGIIINELLPAAWFDVEMITSHAHHIIPHWLQVGSTVFLGVMMIYVILLPYLPKKKTQTTKNNNMEYKIKVDGMSCNHCTSSVEKNVGQIEGIKSVNADLASHIVTLEADQFDESTIEKTIHDLGYEYKGKA
jgi:hypothetical protein